MAEVARVPVDSVDRDTDIPDASSGCGAGMDVNDCESLSPSLENDGDEAELTKECVPPENHDDAGLSSDKENTGTAPVTENPWGGLSVTAISTDVEATVLKPIGLVKKSSVVEKPGFLSLPLDALHGIASFLKPSEWSMVALLNHNAHRIYRETTRRVRIHGFKCATEIVTAWKLGQHEDARELASLYISAGVPVYPMSLGYSYQTLLWRMGVEANELNRRDASNQETDAAQPVDLFYLERAGFRNEKGYSPEITYAEEKCLFFYEKFNPDAGEARDAQPSPFSRNLLSPSSNSVASSGNNADGATLRASLVSQHSKAKQRLVIHRHLLDQHLAGQFCVDDEDGAMVTPPVSLSADFYHFSTTNPSQQLSSRLARRARDHSSSNRWAALEQIEENVAQGAAARGLPAEPLHGQEPEDRVSNNVIQVPDRVCPAKLSAAMSCSDMVPYSSAKTDCFDEDLATIKVNIQSRFATYQRRLEGFLAQRDNRGFEECVLDFWDEFFPHTAGIHYYDRHTAVPRISMLRKFLSKPCPKAVGIVQCEIERIRIPSKSKGMKSRFFPTYEYRLFIRNRPHAATQESASGEPPEDFVRKDTVLMVAKTRSRKTMEGSPANPISSSAKKSGNNYYLYLPQQNDVDAHFNLVNGNEHPVRMNPNGASHEPVLCMEQSDPLLLGRLQSNFIGTEFQIFTPRAVKGVSRKAESQYIYSPSDDDLDYDSGVSSDNSASRRARFGKISFRRNSSSQVDIPEDSEFRLTGRSTKGRRPQAQSGADVPVGSKSRVNRKVANTPENQKPDRVIIEEEDGVIAYTANLLGSRPRIMDVCVPRVSAEGVPAVEWKQYIDSAENAEDCRMIDCFRQLLQRLESQEAEALDDHGPDRNDVSRDDFGLLALQNRPPWWNVELGSFVLNFGGRVSVPSVKNFQLCDRTDHERIILQFGRIQGRHSFTMDFQHPLTAVQAFSIALSSLQSKISF